MRAILMKDADPHGLPVYEYPWGWVPSMLGLYAPGGELPRCWDRSTKGALLEPRPKPLGCCNGPLGMDIPALLDHKAVIASQH